ncbi:hypothetical protein GCM10023310_01080 [Paenibacillus vulneris]|uniref:SGNH/GDSL hydrolase family protein n=1 Tax=Paenibacillus vulneris TaxID=1133364 RepID=A0ABW3UX99_9BACL
MIIKKPGSGSVDLPNRNVVIKFGEENGAPTFNGKPIGGSSQNQTVLNDLSDIGGVLGYKGMPVSNGGSGSGSTNLIIGGDVKFSVDFVAKTISYTTWNLFTSKSIFTLNQGSKTFTTELGSGTFYFVCYKSNNIELVTAANIGAYTGYVVFGVSGTTVYPFSYPLNQIGIRGGSFPNRKDLAIGEWTLIGDSITFGGGQAFVTEVFPVPVVTNLAVNGKRMSGGSGMWKDKDIVTATTELCTIMGGTNDEGGKVAMGAIQPVGSAFDTNTYVGAYQVLIEGLLAKNPKMIIILITPSRAWTDNTGETERTGMQDYADMVKEIGKFYCLPVVDLYNEMGLNRLTQSTYLSDGLHPNDAGKRRISSLVIGAIRRYWMHA